MVWYDEWAKAYPSCPGRDQCAYARVGLCDHTEGRQVVISRDLVLDRCPWAELEGALPMLNRILRLHQHWKHGALAAVLPEPSSEIAELIAHTDQQVILMQAELAERRAKS